MIYPVNILEAVPISPSWRVRRSLTSAGWPQQPGRFDVKAVRRKMEFLSPICRLSIAGAFPISNIQPADVLFWVIVFYLFIAVMISREL